MTGQSNVVGGGPSVLRELNLRHVLTVIRRDGPLSRADLRRLTGLSRPTINEVVADLLARAWIADEHASEETWTGPGPRPRLLRFRAEMGAVVGVDVGAAKTLVVIADLDGEVRSKVRVPTHGITPSRRLVDHTVKTVIRALSDAGTDASGVHCAVLSTPGVVDPVTGVVTLAPQLGDWGGLPPAVQLSDRLGCPVTVENEMALAVLGEHWSGAAQGVENVIYVGLGVGVGAGALIEGKLYRGPHGIAGEIGYLPLRRIEPDGAQTEPGQFEQAVGARGLITRGQSVAGTPEGRRLLELAGGNSSAIDERTVFRAALEGDSAALGIIAGVADDLAYGIAAVALVMDPELIVVGGGLSNAGPALLEPISDRVHSLVPLRGLNIIQSALGDQAAALGAVRRAADLAESRLVQIGEAT